MQRNDCRKTLQGLAKIWALATGLFCIISLIKMVTFQDIGRNLKKGQCDDLDKSNDYSQPRYEVKILNIKVSINFKSYFLKMTSYDIVTS